MIPKGPPHPLYRFVCHVNKQSTYSGNFQIHFYRPIQSTLLEKKNNVWQILGPHSAGPVCTAHPAYPIATPLTVFFTFNGTLTTASTSQWQPMRVKRAENLRDKSKTLTAPARVATTRKCEQTSRLTTSSDWSGSGNNCFTVPCKTDNIKYATSVTRRSLSQM